MSTTPTHGRIEQALDRLHAAARGRVELHYFALLNRILLAIGFIPPGVVKLRGERFTRISPETPIGGFFEALYQTGEYWQFIGWAQVVAGVLILVPRTATLGAVLFFPIILNIFVITVSLQFPGTTFVTGGMLLANTYLLCWDWHRIKAVIFPGAAASAVPAVALAPSPAAVWLERAGFVACAAGGLGVLLRTRSLIPTALVLPSLILGLLGGVLLVASLWMALRARRARTA